MFGTTLLVLTLQFWRSRVGKQIPTGQPTAREKIDDAVETCPRRRKWLPVYFVFVVAVALLAQASGLRMILFPPLIVIAFEMFGHPTICPWAKRPIRMVVACSLAAACGTAAAYWLGAGVISTAIGLVCGILVLRVTDLHVPPALAVALIPQILPSLDYRYPLSVLVGTSVLAIAFQLYRRHQHRPAAPRSSALEPHASV